MSKHGKVELTIKLMAIEVAIIYIIGLIIMFHVDGITFIAMLALPLGIAYTLGTIFEERDSTGEEI